MTTRSSNRTIDEMALVLCGLAELGYDDACIMALLAAGFRAPAIARHLDAARELARAARAGEADLWFELRGQP
jgi:hypothetical protein